MVESALANYRVCKQGQWISSYKMSSLLFALTCATSSVLQLDYNERQKSSGFGESPRGGEFEIKIRARMGKDKTRQVIL